MVNIAEYKWENMGSKVSLWYTKKSMINFDTPNHAKDILFIGNKGKNTNCEETIKIGMVA